MFFRQRDSRREGPGPPLAHSVHPEIFANEICIVSVPVGVSSMDETLVRTTARTPAKSFIPSKRDKYAVMFYAVVS